MNEPQNESSTRSWLSVSQAAAALGISERAVQKRCASGKLAAQRIETPQGTRWEIDANQITRTGTRTNELNARTLDANQRTNSPEPPELSPEPANQEATFHAQNHANERPNQRTEPRELSPELGRVLTNRQDANQQNDFQSHLLEENRFLRTLIEQRDRDAAELRAALRTALAAMPKAITEGETSTRGDAVSSREDWQETPRNAATGKDLSSTRNLAQRVSKHEPRPLWQLIIGYRPKEKK